jgi:hypothetical protein
MSRAMFLSLSATTAASKCEAQNVGVSVIEELPGGGVRLVCNSIDGADEMRRQLKKNLLADDTIRHKWRPRTPLW